MSDFDTGAFRDRYCDLMEEIKQRMVVITNVVNGKAALPQRVAYELCHLQLRLICELIALGCLAAHGDLDEVRGKKLSKEYNADTIMKQLTELHADFYPKPSRQIIDKKTGRPLKVEPITDGFLTKADLSRLYGECGNVLHRGNLRQVLKGDKSDVDLSSVTAWADKVLTLLGHHQIQMIDKDHQFWALMKSGEDGKVHAYLMSVVTAKKDGGSAEA